MQIPIEKFAEVVRMSSVLKFKSDRAVFPNLDVSIPEIGANLVWNRAVSPSTGKNVVVGVIDDGIDLNHADFQIAPGNTRILYLWDQTVTGTPPGGYTYGNECTKAQIDAGTCSQTWDCSVGHGTHTIGIAAGDGSAGGGTYTGVAKEADIIYVKIVGDTADFDTVGGTSRIWDAIKYIKDKAASLGKPAAISLSYGYQGGPHDGFADTDWLIDNTLNNSSSGVSVAISAGNDGDDNLHSDALICPKGAGNYDFTDVGSIGFPWFSDELGYYQGPDLVYEFYYPANKNINVRLGIPVLLDDAAPYNCNNATVENWYTLFFRFTPEIDNIFTTDSKPNVWGVIYGLQRGYNSGSWMLCDSSVGDILSANNKYVRFAVFRDSDCRQLNNSHSGTTRCGTTWTAGGCDYHLDNELPPGTDAIYIVLRPPTPADVNDRASGTVRGCGSTNNDYTCANDLWHCLPCNTGCTAAAPGPGWGFGWSGSPCPTGTPGWGYPQSIDVQFDEKLTTAADAYGDGGCYSACNTYVSNCTGIAEITAQQTEVEGWINHWSEGWFWTWTDANGNPLPEDCTQFIMQGDSRQCIGEPSSAYAAIAAAAYTTKLDGCDNTTDPVGDRPAWSSTGPLRDGTPAAAWAKPEISSPGESIASAKPACVTAACPAGTDYQLMSGTSMSAPHIAGSAALLFQCCPQLTLGQVRDLLNTNALDAGTPGYDNEWGWGKLRVNAAYLDLLPAFAGISSATAVSSSQIDLAWPAATVDECPTGATYDIHRIQGSCPFTPSLANRIATGVSGTTYSDIGLSPSTTYSYIVRAVEGNACTDDNTVCLSATTLGGGLPGEVPQQNGSGTPLTIAKSGTNLQITFGTPSAPCAPTRYELYRGTLPLSGTYNHAPVDCNIAGSPYTTPADTGSYYYFVVAATATEEGSYGKSSSGTERPIVTQCPGVTKNTNPC